MVYKLTALHGSLKSHLVISGHKVSFSSCDGIMVLEKTHLVKDIIFNAHNL